MEGPDGVETNRLHARPGRKRMTDFEKRWGKLTVAEAIELNKAAENSMGDPTIIES